MKKYIVGRKTEKGWVPETRGCTSDYEKARDVFLRVSQTHLAVLMVRREDEDDAEILDIRGPQSKYSTFVDEKPKTKLIMEPS